jgi:hypothetical protein
VRKEGRGVGYMRDEWRKGGLVHIEAIEQITGYQIKCRGAVEFSGVD